MALFTLWLSWGICDLIYKPLINLPYVNGEINIDGSDFTWIANAGVAVVNGVLNIAVVILPLAGYFVLLVIVPLIAWAICSSVLKKQCTDISSEQKVLVHKTFKIFMLGTDALILLMNIIYSVLGKNGFSFLNILLCWQEPLIMWLLYVKAVDKIADVK